MHGTVAALLGLVPLFAHGGVAGAIVELSAGLLIVAVAVAVWVGNRKDGEER